MNTHNVRIAALTGARWTVAARVGTQLITWPATIFVMRLLDPGDYGLFAIALLFIGFIGLFAELGLGVALDQVRDVDDGMARAACTMVLALNGIVAVAIVALAPWVALLYEAPDVAFVMRVLTLELLIAGFAAVPQAMLERQLQFRSLSLAQMAGGLAGAATTFTAALLGSGVWALVIGSLAMAIVRSSMLIVLHRRLVWPGKVSHTTVQPLLHVSSQVLAGRVLWYWYQQADQLILGRLLHAVQLGFFSVAAQLAMLPAGKVMEVVNRVAFPILSRIQKDSEKTRNVHLHLLSLLAIYGFGVCWGLAAIAHDFVALVLGAKWEPAATPLATLALIAPLRMLCAMHNTTTVAIGKPAAATKEVVVAGILVPLAVAGGATWDGLQGAAVAWLLAFPIVYLLSNRLTCDAIGMTTQDGLRPLAAPFVSGCAMLAAVWLVRRALGADASLSLLLGAEIAVGATVYSSMMWLFARDLILEARAFAREMMAPEHVKN